MSRFIGLFFVICLLTSSMALGLCRPDSIPASTPTDRFLDNGNGTVTDLRTRLVWKRCAEGQAWNGATCVGTAGEYTWQDALQRADTHIFAGNDDWRVPDVKELSSIVERQCEYPAINSEVFPATPDSTFWTSSTRVDDATFACVVEFTWGGGEIEGDARNPKSGLVPVRLVRDE
jgi:hypothetical protein